MTKSLLLIITGSIAAYKTLDVIRRLRERDVDVTCILTQGGAQFVTPLSVASLSGNPVYGELFSLKDETEMGHIRLARQSDLIAVIPASADFIAKMAAGRADDLAGATLLAASSPVLIAPAMNVRMWEHPATLRNLAQLQADGVHVVAPDAGMLACGETGTGRLADIEPLVSAVLDLLSHEDVASFQTRPLSGMKALVTAGPTWEAVDPVRFLANRSSGKQGYAIAASLAQAGALVTLVSGPTGEPRPAGVAFVQVESAAQMLDACLAALPADIAVCAAAVCDWKPAKTFAHKIKKRSNDTPPALELTLNPDILHRLATPGQTRPHLVIGFAAETQDILKNAALKRKDKGCDWMVANDVSDGKVFGADTTGATLITGHENEQWDAISKTQLARRLTEHIIHYFGGDDHGTGSTHLISAC